MNRANEKLMEAYWRAAKKDIPHNNRLFAKKYFKAGFAASLTHVLVIEKRRIQGLIDQEKEAKEKSFHKTRNFFKNVKRMFTWKLLET